jgi:hypothetical protein
MRVRKQWEAGCGRLRSCGVPAVPLQPTSVPASDDAHERHFALQEKQREQVEDVNGIVAATGTHTVVVPSH